MFRRFGTGVRARVVRACGATALGPGVTLFIQLVSVPVLLRFWGSETYGQWLILTAIPSYLSMSDMGFGNVAANEMTMQVAGGHYESALRTFQSISTLVISICLAAFLLATALIYTLPVATFLGTLHLAPVQIRCILLLLSAYALIVVFSSTVLAGFRCDGNYALGVVLQNATRLLENSAIMVAVVSNAGLEIAALALLVCRAVCTVSMTLVLIRRTKWLTLGTRNAEIAEVKRLFSPAVSFMIFPLANALNLQGIVLIVGVSLGPVAAAMFSALRTLTRFCYQFLEIIKNGTWPEFSMAFGCNNIARAQVLHKRACQAAFWLALSGVSILSLTGHWIFVHWTHGRLPYSQSVFTLLLGSIVLSALWNTSSVVPMACNAHSRLAGVYLTATATCVVGAAILTTRFGLNGTTASLFGVDLIMCPYVIRTSARLLSERGETIVTSLFFFDSASHRRPATRLSSSVL